MKTNNTYIYLTLFIFLFSCKKNISKIDCNNAKPISANFLIGELVGNNFYETDTIDIRNNSILFKATGRYDSLIWKIGYDPREFTLPTATAQFGIQQIGTTILAKLSVKGSPNFNCFPSDKYQDFSERKFTVVCTDSLDALLYGTTYYKPKFISKWQGANLNNPSEKFIVNIVDLGIDPNPSNDTIFYGLRIYNLPQGCGGRINYVNPNNSACGGQIVSPSNYAYAIDQWGYAGFSVDESLEEGCCPGLKMFGYVYKTDSIHIEYTTNGSSSTKKIFKGKRLF